MNIEKLERGKVILEYINKYEDLIRMLEPDSGDESNKKEFEQIGIKISYSRYMGIGDDVNMDHYIDFHSFVENIGRSSFYNAVTKVIYSEAKKEIELLKKELELL